MPAENAETSDDLERFRAYLRLLASLQLDRRLQGKVDLSGIVQQTLLEGYQARAQLESLNEAQKAAWLRKALAHNLTDEVRRLSRGVRDVHLEQSLERAVEASSHQLENWLAKEQLSPSEQAVRNEELLRLADALAQLPSDQRVAIELHHLQSRPLAEIATVLQRSRGAVGALLLRAMKALRHVLDETHRKKP